MLWGVGKGGEEERVRDTFLETYREGVGKEGVQEEMTEIVEKDARAVESRRRRRRRLVLESLLVVGLAVVCFVVLEILVAVVFFLSSRGLACGA